MKKFIFIILVFILIIVIIIFNKNFLKKENSNNNQIQNTNISRTSTITDSSNNSLKTENTQNTTINEQPISKSPIEEDLANFSTKIYSKKDKSRQKNLEITSSKLNETTLEPGKTFSFTTTVGKATPDKGYEKADIYDENGNKIKGYGGGNCQISSTLYNAVLQLSSLQIVERHPHSKKVPYVETGRDAAVAYGSIDFKFKNNYEFPIKIYCSVDKNNVSIRIVSIK